MRRLTLVAATLFALASLGLAVFAHAQQNPVYETGIITYVKTNAKVKASGSQTLSQNKTVSAVKGVQSDRASSVSTTPQCSPSSISTAAIAPSVGTTTPGLVVAPVAVSYYTVFGNQLAEISNQINRCSPVRESSEVFSASTGTSFSWAVDYSYGSDGMCKVTRASIGLGVHLVYPDWQSRNTAPGTVHSDWQRFMNNLSAHENGHVALARTTANAMLAHLQNFPPTQCANLNSAIQSQVQADIAALNVANQQYDQQTDHGTTQGAVL